MPSSVNNLSPPLVWPAFVLELQALYANKAPRIPLYLVGGSVRDACLRIETTDVDIAVDGDALGIARQTADWLDADLYIMDRERGVARVFVERDSKTILVDFARFRGLTLEDDLRDRDFTYNAMAVDLRGDLSGLIDPLGGAADLRDKVLRLCSVDSIASDPIRALRAIRQSTQFGLRIHPDALPQIRNHGPGMRTTSPERLRDEFFKLLALDDPAKALRNLSHLDLLRYALPGLDFAAVRPRSSDQTQYASDSGLQTVERMSTILTAISRKRTDNTAAAFDIGTLVMQLDRFRSPLEAHIRREYGNGRRHRELLVLAALLGHFGNDGASQDDIDTSNPTVRRIAQKIRLSHEEVRLLVTMVENAQRVEDRVEWTRLERHRFWFQLGESGIDAVLLAAARYLANRGIELDQRSWLRFVENATILLDAWFNFRDSLVYPESLLNGDDIMDMLKIRPGPAVGQLLTALREAQVTEVVTSEAEARSFVARAYKSMS